ncbi:hypothetical protein ACLQ3C_05715 [Gordonia sp. DT30]|uniref:hypothetical protein n=1 Tax=unclassified Gordonia (in: high G+C Gram-positive bacteria) TaxID=2657482 RepID=UPI003CE89AC5
MAPEAEHARVTLWWVITTLVLVIRLLATIATILLVIGWAVAAIRDSMMNGFLWPAVGSGVALLISTYLYSYLRARYPRRNSWLP